MSEPGQPAITNQQDADSVNNLAREILRESAWHGGLYQETGSGLVIRSPGLSPLVRPVAAH